MSEPRLMHDLVRYVEELGIVSIAEDGGGQGNVFFSRTPEVPDELVYVNTIGGVRPDPKLPYRTGTVQFIVRGDRIDARPSYDLASEILSNLHGLWNETLPEGTYLVSCLAQTGEPVSMGRDDNDRYEWSITFDAEVQKQLAHQD